MKRLESLSELTEISRRKGHKICLLCLYIFAAMSLLLAPLISPITFAASHAGEITGLVSLSLESGRYFLTGWACQQAENDSIRVHIYTEHSAYDKPSGKFVLAGDADVTSEQEVAARCHCSTAGKHRFKIELPEELLASEGGKPLFVHGIRVSNGVPNSALGGSGEILFPCKLLTGAYKSERSYPRVFYTEDFLREAASRCNTAGTFSSQIFDKLAAYVTADLKAKDDWDASYSGTDIDVYLRTFSYESRNGYASEVRSEDQLRSELKLTAQQMAPHGAAVAAARAALYAALIKAGARVPQGAAGRSEAALLSKRILLSWARHGFRRPNGSYLNSPTQFSAVGGTQIEAASGVGLQVSRGIVYSACAQDLLAYCRELTPKEAAECNAFHKAMFDLIVNAEKYKPLSASLPGNVFGNHTANGLAGLLAIARLLDDERRFYAVLYGGDKVAPVPVPWTSFFNRTIYGVHDVPNVCYANTGDNGFSSRPFYQTRSVSPGEIDDRFRNAEPGQGIGYPMFTLERLYNAADIVENAGLDAYGYRGSHLETVELATQFYARYAKQAGFNKIITVENSGSCPNFPQYDGKETTGEPNFIEGAYRFPNNKTITLVEAAAKLSRPVEALRFGRWKN